QGVVGADAAGGQGAWARGAEEAEASGGADGVQGVRGGGGPAALPDHSRRAEIDLPPAVIQPLAGAAAGGRSGVAHANTMLTEQSLMSGYGRPDSRWRCGGDEVMYKRAR